MKIRESIKKGLKIQNIKKEIEETPVNIILKNGIILNFCFIEYENENILIVSETTPQLREEIRIINKEEISHINIVYITPELLKENLKNIDMYN